MNKEEVKYLTPEETAKMLSISTGTLANWRVSSNGPNFIKLSCGKRSVIRYPLHGQNGLIKYMDDRITSSTSHLSFEKKDPIKQKKSCIFI